MRGEWTPGEVISIWTEKGETLRFIEIHKALVKRGIVETENRYAKTTRILASLVEAGLIEKVGRGRYQVKVNPYDYALLENILLKPKSKFRVGGFLWTDCEGFFLDFPEEAFNYTYVKYVLNIIGVRLARIFNALRELATIVKEKGEKGIIPSSLIRELILELPAYWLGCKAGIDRDGLAFDELLIAYEKMLHSLPETIEAEEGWSSPTLKEAILKDFEELKNLFKLWQDENLEVDEDSSKHFGLILIPPSSIFDEESYTRKWIIDIIKDSAARDEPPFYTALSLPIRDEEIVLKVLREYGERYLGAKVDEVRRFYEMRLAAFQIAVYHRLLMMGRSSKEIISKVRWIAKKAADEYGANNIIKLLPFFGSEFGGPTPEKERILKLIFKEQPLEKIHEWLKEGEDAFQKYAEYTTKIAKESIETYKEKR
ncbi:MAG: hypothetical protein DRN49_04465 [Thaumarchaeota archaeon]|nr:MAG: hypothetical protein DRN49_04465 [Nitrososphaerota archaeon]